MKNKTKIISMVVLSFLIILFMAGCTFEQNKIKSMPKYDKEECYWDEEGFRDYTDYCKYFYNDDTVSKFENDKRFKKIEEEDVEILTGFFNNYNGWVNNMKWYDKYDFDYQIQLKPGDYYYLIIKDENTVYGIYHNYDIYYVDMEKAILYYFHSNS